jgi:hypothetical protein
MRYFSDEQIDVMVQNSLKGYTNCDQRLLLGLARSAERNAADDSTSLDYRVYQERRAVALRALADS